MVHAARALGLVVMLGCMIESSARHLAPAAQLASLCDFVDLDGHLLISDDPSEGLGLEDGRIVLSQRPGLGVEPLRVSERVAIFAEAWLHTSTARPPTASSATASARSSPSSTRCTPGRRVERGRARTRNRPVPIVATVAEAAALGAQCLAIGVAPAGGKLPPEWRGALLEAIALGMHVEAGLHDELGRDPELVAAAAARGLELRDLRRVPAGLSTPSGAGLGRARRAIVHTVGSDCAIGKMTVTLELAAAAQGRRRARGLRARPGRPGSRSRAGASPSTT